SCVSLEPPFRSLPGPLRKLIPEALDLSAHGFVRQHAMTGTCVVFRVAHVVRPGDRTSCRRMRNGILEEDLRPRIGADLRGPVGQLAARYPAEQGAALCPERHGQHDGNSAL